MVRQLIERTFDFPQNDDEREGIFIVLQLFFMICTRPILICYV